MPTYHAGRHEFGQNFLHDQQIIDKIVDLVSQTKGPIVEIGSGGGAVTLPLQTLCRPITAVEIDGRNAASLRLRVNPNTTVVNEDFLCYRLPSTPFTIVGCLPFHLTTAILRRILHTKHWTSAILMVQWEVARRRAAIGGATMMTAQWWPWYTFGLDGRVPASAFTPRPSVDGGLLTISRRTNPLVDPTLQPQYRNFVHKVFTGKGHGLKQILSRVAQRQQSAEDLNKWIVHQGFARTPLPRDLSAEQWSQLFDVINRRR